MDKLPRYPLDVTLSGQFRPQPLSPSSLTCLVLILILLLVTRPKPKLWPAQTFLPTPRLSPKSQNPTPPVIVLSRLPTALNRLSPPDPAVPITSSVDCRRSQGQSERCWSQCFGGWRAIYEAVVVGHTLRALCRWGRSTSGRRGRFCSKTKYNFIWTIDIRPQSHRVSY